jgi:hypothetical protein
MTEEELKAQLNAVYASTSWRVTAPLRFVGGVARGMIGLFARPRAALREVLKRMARNEAIRRFAVRMLEPFPELKKRIRNSVIDQLQYAPQPAVSLPIMQEEAALSFSAREVLAELRRAKNQKI